MRNTDFNTRGLDQAISHEYPVNAVNFLRRNPVGGPLYNSFDFGGFLIFYMPQYPVSIDGRTDLYGDAMVEQYFSTQEADPSYTTDPLLNEAGVVILKNKFPIAGMLLTDRRFRVIYRDNIATVFVRQLVESNSALISALPDQSRRLLTPCSADKYTCQIVAVD